MIMRIELSLYPSNGYLYVVLDTRTIYNGNLHGIIAQLVFSLYTIVTGCQKDVDEENLIGRMFLLLNFQKRCDLVVFHWETLISYFFEVELVVIGRLKPELELCSLSNVDWREFPWVDGICFSSIDLLKPPLVAIWIGSWAAGRLFWKCWDSATNLIGITKLYYMSPKFGFWYFKCFQWRSCQYIQ